MRGRGGAKGGREQLEGCTVRERCRERTVESSAVTRRSAARGGSAHDPGADPRRGGHGGSGGGVTRGGPTSQATLVCPHARRLRAKPAAALPASRQQARLAAAFITGGYPEAARPASTVRQGCAADRPRRI